MREGDGKGSAKAGGCSPSTVCQLKKGRRREEDEQRSFIPAPSCAKRSNHTSADALRIIDSQAQRFREGDLVIYVIHNDIYTIQVVVKCKAHASVDFSNLIS